jgi:hypothetical protein
MHTNATAERDLTVESDSGPELVGPIRIFTQAKTANISPYHAELVLWHQL